VLGTVAQLIALVAYGNAFLQNHFSQASDFYPANSSFKFCEYVRFVDIAVPNRTKQEQVWAENPVAWLQRLRSDGVYALRLHYRPVRGKSVGGDHLPDRMLAGFVGGAGRWLVETVSPRGSDYWEGRWEVGDQSRSDRRIWRVTYARVLHNQVTQKSDLPDFENLKRSLSIALEQIQSYAASHRLDYFAKVFESSRSQLSAEMPKGSFHPDLTPPGQLSLTGRQLLSAAQIGWVFGGMGSWNDSPPNDAEKDEYERVSEQLFVVLNRTYVGIANSTAR
jgi:hypothetical protein